MTGERLYSALLRAYPARFRREYGAEMIEAFRRIQAEHRASRTALWRFLMADFARAVLVAHAQEWRSVAPSFSAEWALACASGAGVSAFSARALTWTIAYFYHPYLEGLVVAPWAYGLLIGAGLGSAQAMVLRRRLRVGVSWIIVTAAGAALGLQAASAIAPAPIASGVVLGLTVGASQWVLLRARFGAAVRWIAGSGVAVSIALFACAAGMQGMLGGLGHVAHYAPNTLAYTPWPPDLPNLATNALADLAVMMASGLLIAAFTAHSLSVFHAPQKNA